MTEVQEAVTTTAEMQQTEGAERPLLRREFSADLVENSDGRTLEGLCVPFNRPTVVSDGGPAYREMFVMGAFQRAVKAPFRVLLNFEHHQGMPNVLGAGVSFEERADGLYGSLEIDEGPDGDKALRLYRQKVLESLSVEFKSMAKAKTVDGVVVRDNVHLNAVALCRQGAYPDAKVLAVRTDEHLIDESLLPIPVNPEIAERCRLLLPVVPQRYEAHPDVTDTPAEPGTSEDGTRQPMANADLEVPDESHHDTE